MLNLGRKARKASDCIAEQSRAEDGRAEVNAGMQYKPFLCCENLQRFSLVVDVASASVLGTFSRSP